MKVDSVISERLVIRDVTENDAKHIWEIWSNSENEKYMSDPVKSIDEVKSICKERENDINNGFLRVATLKTTGEVIGTCCFGFTNKSSEWGFGYSIKVEYWRNGYATEIVKSIIKLGYDLGIREFISDCATENLASGRVLEKCGMNLDHKSTFKQPKLNVVYDSDVYKLHIR